MQGRILSLSTIVASESHRPDMNAGAAQWASERIFGKPDGFRDYATVTVMRGGAVVAVIVLHNWREEFGVLEISAAGGGGWQSRRVVNQVMSLCFDAMGCQTVATRCGSDRPDVIENMRKLGFSEAVLPNLRGAGVDEWVFTITHQAWKSGRIYKPI